MKTADHQELPAWAQDTLRIALTAAKGLRPHYLEVSQLMADLGPELPPDVYVRRVIERAAQILRIGMPSKIPIAGTVN